MPLLPPSACARGGAVLPLTLPAAVCSGRPAPPQLPGFSVARTCKAADAPPVRRSWARRLSREYSLAPLTEHGLLGHGAFGTVRVAHPRGGGASVAVKCIPKDGEGSQRAIMREAGIMRSLDHGSVCRLEGVYEDDENMYLVLEHIDGHELFDEIQDDGLGDERAAKDVMRQIFEALAHCHEQGVIHRDVKLENIMIERKLAPGARRVAKLIDFGMAVEKGLARLGNEPLASTEPYLAPEAHTCGFWEPSLDCWSAGVVMHALLTGLLLPPAVAAGKEPLDLNSEALRAASPAALQLLAGLLQVDAEKRLTASEAARHRWIQEEPDPDCGELCGGASLRRQNSSGCDSTASTADCSLSPRRSPANAEDTAGITHGFDDIDDLSPTPRSERAAGHGTPLE